MRRILLSLSLVSLLSVAALAQKEAAGKSQTSKFPGVSASQLSQLQNAKRFTALPLPTWLPAGFKLEKVDAKLGSRIQIQDRYLALVYSRTLASGKKQRFGLEAGFDGIGDLMYDGAKTIPSAFGKIYLLYEPNDSDETGKKLSNYVMTEWFTVGKTAFHYIGMYGEEDDPSLAMISLADTEKILRSLQRF